MSGVYRLASVAAGHLLKGVPEGDPSAAMRQGRVVAAARVVTSGAYAKARAILDDILSLVKDGVDTRPRARVVRWTCL